MTLQEIQYRAQSIISKWRDDDSAPYIEFVEELAHMIVPEPSEDLEEASSKFATLTTSDGVSVEFLYEKLSFQEGAKWQKEQDGKDLSEKIAAAYQLGLADKEEQMMKDAVEAELYLDGDFLAIDLDMAELGYSERDKVRIIVVK